MSSDPNPDLESEVREIENHLRETREHLVEELSKQLLDPNLSNTKRTELEEHLRELKKKDADDDA